MKSIKLLAISMCVVSLAGGAFAQQPQSKPNMNMSAADQKMMSDCMGMSHDMMMKDKTCTGMMKKMKMSDADMMKMSSCKGMSKDAMMADKACMSMMKMHPDMMSAPK